MPNSLLTLTRKANESILLIVPGIAEPITITVHTFKGDKCRVTTSAPADVAIYRQEVYDRMAEEVLGNLEADLQRGERSEAVTPLTMPKLTDAHIDSFNTGEQPEVHGRTLEPSEIDHGD